MRQQSVDREVRVIVRFTFFMLVVGFVSLMALAYWMPFDVKLHALYAESQGSFFVRDLRSDERIFDAGIPVKLQPGEQLRLDAGNSGRVEIVEKMNAYAYLTGPVRWGLESAQRRGTVIEHVLSQENATYELSIEQGEGVVVYDFSQSEPPLRDLNLMVRLPDGEFIPISDCFQASAPTDTTPGAVVEIPCYGEAQPAA